MRAENGLVFFSGIPRIFVPIIYKFSMCCALSGIFESSSPLEYIVDVGILRISKITFEFFKWLELKFLAFENSFSFEFLTLQIQVKNSFKGIGHV